MVSSELKGLSVLITRPQEQSEASATVIVEQGGNPIIFPTLEIVPVEPLGGWALLMERLKTADIAVFTSANAVRQLFSQGGGITGRCQVAAIGTATQMALAEFGVSCDWLPMTDYRSEGLLELPVFQAVAQKKILLFAGEGGREYLQDILTGRGAIVE
jgi:uroporphyrinogen-III synthase